MPHTMRQVLADALTLPPVDRAELIEALFFSFDNGSREQIDRLWALEAEDRIEAYERGEIGAISATAVFEKINAWTK
jgi:putative addiction module component (TIGR02574 family)